MLIRAAELHDVGKVAVPDVILNKPGPLDDAEWAIMRQHTVAGERILGTQREHAAGRADRARVARALGRPRLPGRARRRGDPARGADRVRLRRL